MKGPYALWGCGRGYVQIGSVADQHEQRVEAMYRERREAFMKAARSLRWLARDQLKMGVSFRELAESLNHYAQALRMGPPSPKFTDWNERFEWM